jgi:hypothetical protein
MIYGCSFAHAWRAATLLASYRPTTGQPPAANVPRGADAQDIAGRLGGCPVARPDAAAATWQSFAEKARAGLFETPENLPNPV